MKEIRTVDAVGKMLCHDMTRIIAGESKGARFRRGHVIEEKDIEILLSMGKEHIYILDEDEADMVHEEDAAKFLYDLCVGHGVEAGEIKEGRINGFASYDGMLYVNDDLLYTLNMIKDVSIATKKGGIFVKQGENILGARVIPLYVSGQMLEDVENTLKLTVNNKDFNDAYRDNKIVSVKKFVNKSVGIVVTGSEVYKGLVNDGFTPVLEKKLSGFGASIDKRTVVDDNHELTSKAILECIDSGVDIVLCTGGMSVDPDDRTPLAIKNTGADIVSYGSPVLPGSMCLVSYFNKGDKTVPVLGLPGAVMYFEKTAFDYFLPYVLCGEKIDKEFIAKLGNGGLL